MLDTKGWEVEVFIRRRRDHALRQQHIHISTYEPRQNNIRKPCIIVGAYAYTIILYLLKITLRSYTA